MTTPETARLRLVPYTPEHLLALIEEPERFEQHFGLPVADGLREFMGSDDVSADWLALLRSSSAPDPWTLGFAVVHQETQQVIGSASFKGQPDADGTVEIAYGTVPSFQGQGYATEAAAALVSYALEDSRVRVVRAHTLPEQNASTGVLRKLGFQLAGEVMDPEDGLVWRWEHARPAPR